MDVTVLGQVTVNGTARISPRDRVVLEALAIHLGRPVSADQLADAMWRDTPPPSRNKILQGCIVRLRKELGAEAVVTSPQGYALRLAGEEIDAVHFEHQVERARELLMLGQHDRVAFLLVEALSLWQGEPYVDVEEWPPAQAEAQRLRDVRLEAEELLVDAQLRSGRQTEVLPRARTMVKAAPMRERRWALLAIAQYRAGNQAEALRTLHELKTVLVQQLGIDPSPEVLDLEKAILRQDPAILGRTSVPPARSTCPWQGLHAYDEDDADRFFGRDQDISACLTIMGRTPLLALVGPSGSGKSSLLKAGVGAVLASRGRTLHVITPGAHPVDVLPVLDDRAEVLLVDQLEEVFTSCEDPDERLQFVDAVVAEASRRTVAVAIRADHLADVVAHPGLSRLVEHGMHLVGGLGEDGLREAIVGPARQFGLIVEPGLVDLLVQEVGDDPGALPLLSHALLETWKRRDGATLTVAGYRASGGIRDAVSQSAEQLYSRVHAARRHELRDLVLRLVSPGPEGVPVRARVPRRLVATDPVHEELIEMLVAARLVTSDDGVLEITHEALTRAWPRLRGWLDDDVEGQRIRYHLTAAADAWDALARPDSELYRGVRLARVVDWKEHTRTSLTEAERAFLDRSSDVAASDEREVRERARVQARLIRRLRIVLAGAVALLVVALAAGGVAGLQTSRARSSAAVARAAQASAEDNAVAAEARQAGIRAAATADIDQSVLLAAAAMELDGSPSSLSNLTNVLANHPALIDSVSLPAADKVEAVEVSPAGGEIAMIDDHHLVTVVDRTSGAQKTFQAGPELAESIPLRALAWSPDGQSLAVGRTAGSTPPVLLLDPQTLTPLGHQLGGLPAGRWQVADLSWSHDGRSLAAGLWRVRRANGGQVAGDAIAAVWRLDRPRSPALVDVAGSPKISDNGYLALALSPDGRHLYVAPDARVYDVRTGHSRRFTSETLGTALGGVAVSPDGRLVVVSQDQATGRAESSGAVIVDAHTGRTLRRISPHYFADDFRFSERGDRLLTVDWAEDVRHAQVWDVASGRLVGTALIDGGSHRAADLTPDGSTVVSASWDGAVRTWDPFGNHSYLKRVQFHGPMPIACMATPSPDGEYVAFAICSNDPTKPDEDVVLLDVTRRRTHLMRHANPGYWVGNGGWDGSRYLHATGGTFHVLDAQDGSELSAMHPLGNHVVDAAYTPDREHIVAAEHSGRLTLLDADTFKPTGRGVDLDRPPLLVAAGPGESAFVVYGGSATSTYWNVPADKWAVVDLRVGKILARGSLDVRYPIWAVMSADGRHVALTGTTGQVGIIDLGSGRPVQHTVQAHDAASYWAAFSPDGSHLVTNAQDGSVLLWDVGTARTTASTQLGGSSLNGVAASASAFRSDGRTVLIAPESGHAVYVWDPSPERALAFACRMAGRDLTRGEWADNFPDQPYRETCPDQ
jgi:WD40 repeat protein/DNA-binding SARP family transcriptional activator/energy-coupling factor transporter ATP-binding protein EcfA2